ncbi:MAG: hypothetical protein MRY76_05915 [Pseudomonadales bacterium]|nr:hypothetical protein [Pseudomonadales bacterium]
MNKPNKLAIVVAAQHRVDIGRDNVLFIGGIDNLLDEGCAVHISRAEASIAGFDQIMQDKVPTRAMCLIAQFAF